MIQIDYRRALSLAAAFVLATAGSADAARDVRSANDRRPVVQRLSCANGGTPRRLPIGPDDASLGPVRFSNGRFGADYPPRHFEPTRRWGFFRLKAPLRVDPGARVRIAVAPADRGHVWFGYGAVRADLLDIVACRQMKPTVWLGAIVVDGPQCARLRIIHRGTTSILRIPFGRGACR